MDISAGSASPLVDKTGVIGVIDDEWDIVQLYRDALLASGFSVYAFTNPLIALEHFKVNRNSYVLIISDLRMPGMDGYKLARQLRGSPRTALVPIVFLTAKDETADRIEGFRAGVDAYLTKPFEPDELIAVVNGILNRVERTHSQIRGRVLRRAIHGVERGRPSLPSPDPAQGRRLYRVTSR